MPQVVFEIAVKDKTHYLAHVQSLPHRDTPPVTAVGNTSTLKLLQTYPSDFPSSTVVGHHTTPISI